MGTGKKAHATAAGDDPTPSATEGETDSEWDDGAHEARTPPLSTTVMAGLPDTFAEGEKTATKDTFDHVAMTTTTTTTTTTENSLGTSSVGGNEGYRLSMKALTIKYLQKPMVIFSNIDTFRYVPPFHYRPHTHPVHQLQRLFIRPLDRERRPSQPLWQIHHYPSDPPSHAILPTCPLLAALPFVRTRLAPEGTIQIPMAREAFLEALSLCVWVLWRCGAGEEDAGGAEGFVGREVWDGYDRG